MENIPGFGGPTKSLTPPSLPKQESSATYPQTITNPTSNLSHKIPSRFFLIRIDIYIYIHTPFGTTYLWWLETNMYSPCPYAHGKWWRGERLKPTNFHRSNHRCPPGPPLRGTLSPPATSMTSRGFLGKGGKKGGGFSYQKHHHLWWKLNIDDA